MTVFSISRFNTKYWRIVYGAIYACAAVALAVALVSHAPSIAVQAVARFNGEWLFGSWSKLAMGVIPFITLWLLLIPLERRFPAGPLKPVSNWVLNLKMALVLFISGPFTDGLLGVLLGYLSDSIG